MVNQSGKPIRFFPTKLRIINYILINKNHFTILFLTLILSFSCTKSTINNDEDDIVIEEIEPEETVEFADIDFTNWKVTLPVDEDNNGSPDEYKPSQLIDYGYH